MVSTFPIGQTIEVKVPPIGRDRAKFFREAIASEYSSAFLPTLATLFRDSEFQWLDRLEVDWHKLLHAEQQYEYASDLPLDKELRIASTLKQVRSRKTGGGSLTFVELETRISSDVHHVTAHTHFVVRDVA